MATAGILAAVASLTSSVPILIGAMIVALAFGPLALVAFGLAGGKGRLALRGLSVATVELVISTASAMVTTWLMNVAEVLPLEGSKSACRPAGGA